MFSPSLIQTGAVKTRLLSLKKGLPFVKLSDGLVSIVVTESLTGAIAHLLAPQQISKWSQPRSAVGFDRFILLGPPKIPDQDFHVTVFNSVGAVQVPSELDITIALGFAFNKGLLIQTPLRIQAENKVIHFLCVPSHGIAQPLDPVELVTVSPSFAQIDSASALLSAGFVPRTNHYLIPVEADQWAQTLNGYVPTTNITFFFQKQGKNGIEIELFPNITGIERWYRLREILAYLFHCRSRYGTGSVIHLCEPGFYRLCAYPCARAHQTYWIHKNYYCIEGYAPY